MSTIIIITPPPKNPGTANTAAEPMTVDTGAYMTTPDIIATLRAAADNLEAKGQ